MDRPLAVYARPVGPPLEEYLWMGIGLCAASAVGAVGMIGVFIMMVVM